jgi:two-component system sensor histidine kinase KdpD
VARLLNLAEELGATVVTVPSPAVTEAVIRYARTHNVTKIIAGKPLRSRWIELLRRSVVDQIIQQSGNIDVYVISGEAETTPVIETRSWQPHRPWRRYLQSLALVAAATLLGWPLLNMISPANLVMLYLAVVVVAAIYLGRGPSIVAAVFSVLALDFFLVPPVFTFTVSDTQYVLTFAGLLIVGLVISTLTARVREQVDMVQQREAQTIELYEFSRDLAAAIGLEEIMQSTIKHIGETFSRQVVILLPEGATLKPRASTPGLIINDNELAVATWAFQHGQPAGRGTDTLPAATG